MTVSGMVFERHGREFPVVNGTSLPGQALRGNPADPCNNVAEAAERRSDAQIAERIIIILPHELTLEQAVWAVQDHIREFTRQGRVVQVAIHSPEPGHDSRNLHAHLLVSLRGVDENGLKPTKAAEQQERFMNRSAYVEHLRENWAHVVNRHLARHGYEVQLDYRSYRRQGLDLEPTLHMGPGDAARERRGERTAVGDYNRAVAERNAERLAQRAERERQAIDKTVEQRHAPAPELVDARASPWSAAIVEGWHKQPEPEPASTPKDHLASDLMRAITAALGSRDSAEQHARLLEGVDRAVFVNTGSEVPQSDLATSLMRVVTSALNTPEPEPVLIKGTAEAVRRHDLRQQREAAVAREPAPSTSSGVVVSPSNRQRAESPAVAQEAPSAPRLISDRDELKRLQRDAYADRGGNGRPLKLEGMASELSPAFKALIGERYQLLDEARRERERRQELGRTRDQNMRDEADYRRCLGWWRNKFTDWHIVSDPNIDGWRRGAAEAEQKLAEIRTAGEVRQAQLASIDASIKGVLEHLMPAAEAALRDRQAIARTARDRLRQHYEAEKEAGPFDKLRRRGELVEPTARKPGLAQWKERPMETTSTTTPLYYRYKDERDAADQAREATVQEVYDRFAAYDQQARNAHNLRVEQEKAAVQSGHARHEAIEILNAIHRSDRVEVQMQRDAQLAAAYRDHPLPNWESWLKREADRGDREAARALEQRQARERENGIER